MLQHFENVYLSPTVDDSVMNLVDLFAAYTY